MMLDSFRFGTNKIHPSPLHKLFCVLVVSPTGPRCPRKPIRIPRPRCAPCVGERKRIHAIETNKSTRVSFRRATRTVLTTQRPHLRISYWGMTLRGACLKRLSVTTMRGLAPSFPSSACFLDPSSLSRFIHAMVLSRACCRRAVTAFQNFSPPIFLASCKERPGSQDRSRIRPVAGIAKTPTSV